MPFTKRIIEPIKLGIHPVEEEYKFDLDIFSNRKLIGALRQLGSLLSHSDQIFSELVEECQHVCHRTERLNNRIKHVTELTTKLNAKAVKIPVSDLATVSQVTEHFRSEHGYSCNLFSPATRPDHVRALYAKAAPTPVQAIRSCNALRADGHTGSRIFSIPPVITVDVQPPGAPLSPDTERIKKEQRDKKSVQFVPLQVSEFERRSRAPRKARPRSLPALTELDVYANVSHVPLPTPEEKMREMSRSQPVALVPIDTTSFERISENRQSIRASSREYIDDGTGTGTGTGTRRRGKRRGASRSQTVAGIPCQVMTELTRQPDIRLRSMSRDRWDRPHSMVENYAPRESRRGRERRREIVDNYDPEETNLARSCSLRRSLRSLFKGSRSKSGDLWVEGRPVSPGPPVVNLTSNLSNLKRSRSLPRSLKSMFRNSMGKLSSSRSASTEGRLDSCDNDEEVVEAAAARMDEDIAEHVTHIIHRPPASKISRMKRSKSDHGCSSFVGSGTIERPSQFLDVPVPGSLRAIPVSTPTTPSNESLESSSSASSSSSRLPVGAPPWYSVDVKLRQSKSSLREQADRHSSSGHWSGSSSSARVSLESDYAKSISSPDKDSALSLNMATDERFNNSLDTNGDDTSITEDCSTVNDDTSTLVDETSSTLNGSVVENVENNFTKMSTDDWLQTLNIKKGSGKKKSKRGSLERQSDGLTTQNLLQHEALLPYGKSQGIWLGDDESSIFSCDQDGFFTSMHKDSGLSKSQVDISEQDNDSSVCDYRSATMDSALRKKSKRTAKQNRNVMNRNSLPVSFGNKKKTPPPPPVRISSDKNNLNALKRQSSDSSHFVSSTSTINSTDSGSSAVYGRGRRPRKVDPPSVLNESVVSESDTEAICARLRVKTNICSSGIPMMVSVTPCASDEEDTEMLDFKSEWRNRQKQQIHHAIMGSPKVVPVSVNHVNTTVEIPKRMQSIQESETGGLSDRSLDDSVLPSDTSLEWADIDGYSTWPRSPRSPQVQREAKIEAIVKKASPPKTLNFNPVTPNKVQQIPEPKTPDDLGNTRRLSSFDSFKDPGKVTSPYAVSKSIPSPSSTSPVSPQNAVSRASTHYAVSPVAVSASTWPRKKSAVKLDMTNTSTEEEDTESSIDPSTFPQPMEKLDIRTSRLVTPPSTLKLKAAPPKPEPVASELVVMSPTYSTPVAASARLIISSPVANKAEYVENPHKRSLCSPVTDHDMAVYTAYNTEDKWYNTLPRGPTSPVFDPNRTLTSENGEEEVATPKTAKSPTFEFGTSTLKSEFQFKLSPESAFKPISSPLFPDLDSMKHSISFPDAKKKAPVKEPKPVNYGRTWYDGVDETKPSSETPQRRGSNASSISTTSSGSGKKSVTFASIHRSSLSSLNVSEVGSAGSGKSAEEIKEEEDDEEGQTLKRSVSTSSALSSSSSGSSGSQSTAVGEVAAPIKKVAAEPNAKRQKTTTPVIKAANTKNRPRLMNPGNKRASLVNGVSSIPENQMWTNHANAYKVGDSVVTPEVKPVQSMLSPAADMEGKVVVNLTEKPCNKTVDGKILITPTSKKQSDKQAVKINMQTFAATSTPNGTLERPKSAIGVEGMAAKSFTFTAPVSPPKASQTSFSLPRPVSFTSFSAKPTTTLSKASSLDSRPTFTIASSRPVISQAKPLTPSSSSSVPISSASSVVPSSTFSRTVQVTSSAAVSQPKPVQVSTVTATSQPKPVLAQMCTAVPQPKPVQARTIIPVSQPKPVQTSTSAAQAVSLNNSVFTIPAPKAVSVSSAFVPLLTSSVMVTSSPKSRTSFTEPIMVKSSPTPPRFVLPKLRAYGTKTSLPAPSTPGVKDQKYNQATTITSSPASVVPSTSVITSSAATTPPKSVSTNDPTVVVAAAPSITYVTPVLTSKPPIASPPVTKDTKPSFNRSDSAGLSTGRQALSGSSTSLNRFSSGSTGLNQFNSNSSLAKSLTNLTGMSLPGNSLRGSMCSLAQSNDSLASNSSIHSERNRAAKIAFLTTNAEAEQQKPKSDDPFSKFSLGQKRLSASRTSLASVKENIETSFSRSDSVHSDSSSSSKIPVQGRFVSSIINRFEESSDSNTSLNVGSTPGTPQTPRDNKYNFTVTVNGNNSNNSLNSSPKDQKSNLKNSPVNNNKTTSPRDQLLLDIKSHRKESLTNGSAGKSTNQRKEPVLKSRKSSNGIVGILGTMKDRIQTLPNKRASMCSMKSLNSSQEWD